MPRTKTICVLYKQQRIFICYIMGPEYLADNSAAIFVSFYLQLK